LALGADRGRKSPVTVETVGQSIRTATWPYSPKGNSKKAKDPKRKKPVENGAACGNPQKRRIPTRCLEKPRELGFPTFPTGSTAGTTKNQCTLIPIRGNRLLERQFINHMTSPARPGVRNGHRASGWHASDRNVCLQRNVEDVGPHRTLPVGAILFLLRIGIGRRLDHPSKIPRDAARIGSSGHMTIDAACLLALHSGVELLFHVGQHVHRMTSLAQGRRRIIGIANQKAPVGCIPVHVVAI